MFFIRRWIINRKLKKFLKEFDDDVLEVQKLNMSICPICTGQGVEIKQVEIYCDEFISLKKRCLVCKGIGTVLNK